mmetsp:Transcript_14401/g.31002  ORF Transcript_14401/g.31002 Transcript_14401/m.31002 type:complete len:201 (-) Transcript_14401:703-1305(-)
MAERIKARLTECWISPVGPRDEEPDGEDGDDEHYHGLEQRRALEAFVHVLVASKRDSIARRARRTLRRVSLHRDLCVHHAHLCLHLRNLPIKPIHLLRFTPNLAQLLPQRHRERHLFLLSQRRHLCHRFALHRSRSCCRSPRCRGSTRRTNRQRRRRCCHRWLCGRAFCCCRRRSGWRLRRRWCRARCSSSGSWFRGRSR